MLDRRAQYFKNTVKWHGVRWSEAGLDQL
jgi:hypothetical protein